MPAAKSKTPDPPEAVDAPTAADPSTSAPAPVITQSVIRGRQLIDGQPYFTTYKGVPMNRRQYLAASEPERREAAEAKKAALVAALRSGNDEEKGDEQ